jgi:hypothetical protein
VIDDQIDSSNGIECEKGEILQTGYTALPLEDEDGECSDSENSDPQNASECCENDRVINSVEDRMDELKTICLSDQDVQQIRSAMQRLHLNLHIYTSVFYKLNSPAWWCAAWTSLPQIGRKGLIMD